jgi:valyl-tRNA synthetase
MAKPALRSESPGVADATRGTLAYVLDNALRLLHPFMPFITEEIWQQLPHAEGAKESIMVSEWPKTNAAFRNEDVENRMSLLMGVIGAVRKLRADQGVNPSQKVDIAVTTDNSAARGLIAENDAVVTMLTRGESLAFPEAGDKSGETIFWQEMPVVVAISREMSVEERKKEIEKIAKDLQKLAADAEKLAARLSNPNFVEKAPAEVVAKGRADLAELDHRKASLEERLRALES